jgi:IclR family acetate operon transcriptional repressor
MSEHNDALEGAAPRSGVQSIDRAVAILRCFDSQHPHLGITEIAHLTGLSTSTAHRILTAMLANQLVRSTSGRRYGLGPLLVQLAQSGALATTFHEVALPFMTNLRDEVNETVALHSLLASEDRAVIDQVESHQELHRRYTEIGVPIPLPLGAPGKAILSAMPWDRQVAQLERPLARVAPQQITDPAQLRIELDRTRNRGWAESNAERTLGISSVAAPIFDHSGSVIGALGLSVPSVRMSDDRIHELGRRVQLVAREISAALGATDALIQHGQELARPTA